MKLLTEQEAALALGVPVETLRIWRDQSLPPAYYRLGSQVRYRQEDLDALIDQGDERLWQRQEPAAPAAASGSQPPPEPPGRPADAVPEVADAAPEVDPAELERRRRLIRAIADTPTSPGMPKDDKVFSRPVGQLQTDSGEMIDAADPFSGFTPEEIAGVGHPPETT